MFEQEHYFGRKKNAMTVNIQQSTRSAYQLEGSGDGGDGSGGHFRAGAPIWDGLGVYGKKAGHNYFVGTGAERPCHPD